MIKTKKEVFKEIPTYRLHEKDTGSIPYQVSSLETQIRKAAEHLKKNKQDFPCQRSLIKKNARKKEYLQYWKRRRIDQYNDWLKKARH